MTDVTTLPVMAVLHRKRLTILKVVPRLEQVHGTLNIFTLNES